MKGNVPSVLIAGAGQLGSRYLQGLAQCRVPLHVYVQDPSRQSLDRAAQRWTEVADGPSDHEVSFHASFDLLPAELDVAIVATTADVRPIVVAQVSQLSRVRFWVLEKVLTQSESDLDQLIASIATDSTAWVNTPRRLMPWHQEIRTVHGLNAPVTLSVSGGLWGLGCNAVHFLDLCAWWTGERVVSFDTGRLDAEWFESKRAGFWEVSGTLEARYSGGSRAVLTASHLDVAASFSVSDGTQSWQIDEDVGMARRSDGLEVKGRLIRQSEISGPMVETILESGSCALPSLEDASATQRLFIRALHEHWARGGHPAATAVPIT